MFKRFLTVSALVAAMSTFASAASITYTGDAVPTTPPFTVVIFGGTSMNASSGELRLTTAPVQGVWFGFSGSNADANVGSSSEGNYVGLRTRLSAGATDWNIYLYDGSYMAAFLFQSDGYDFGFGANQTTHTALNLTSYHNFEFWLQNGTVSYAVDGVLKFSGAATAAATSKILVIGDGSGSTPTGSGTMYIDSTQVVTGSSYATGAPEIPEQLSGVPEPASMALAGIGVTGMAVLARRKLRP